MRLNRAIDLALAGKLGCQTAVFFVKFKHTSFDIED